jgi:predicted phage terminase large subunit-like protein
MAAGSGKSYMGLMRFLLYVDDPNFFGYVFRLNATDMKGGGGLFQTACRMFQAYDKRVKYTKQPMCIYFPSGATINFTGIDGDAGLEAIRGIEISAAMVDEGSQHNEDTIFWIISRLRTKAKMIPNIWITCNPSPDSFLCTWLEQYYLYPKGTHINDELVEGRPNPDRDGHLRWFLRIGNQMVWGDTKEELIEKYGKDFPIDRLSGLSTCQPRSFRFISATCHDNPPLLESDPNYVANLLNLPRVEKERLYFGSWYAREESAGFFKRGWVGDLLKEFDDSQVKRWVRAFDIAYSEPSEQNPSPDYTASVLMARMENDEFVVVHVDRVRKKAGEVEQYVIDTIRQDMFNCRGNYQAYIPEDPSAGKLVRVYWAKLAMKNNIAIRFSKVTSVNGKVGAFTPFAGSAENQLVKVVEDPTWNDYYFSELEAFDGKRSTHSKKDDLVDATSLAYNILATSRTLPKISANKIRMVR